MSKPSKLFHFDDRSLDLSKSHVMGILNITPDSFSDGGELISEKGDVYISRALNRAEIMIKAGAAIIDIGGESTRPGARKISSQEEINRVMPVVESVAGNCDAIISVDTSNPELIGLCSKAGVGLINDVRALTHEGALQAAADAGLPVCLMHMQGSPETMQDAPKYSNVVDEVSAFFKGRVAACNAAGIGIDKILLDPGFGFGKTLEHNLELLSRLADLQRLELPVLDGISRKKMIGLITGHREKDRLTGSIAAAVVSVMNGARIVRTHDVEESVDALKICNEILQIS